MARLDNTAFRKTLLALKGARRAPKNLKKGLLKEAHELRKIMVQSFRTQKGGGIKKWAPISTFTAMMRRMRGKRGRKALVSSGQMRKSIQVISSPKEYFIGVPRGIQRKGGEEMINLALLHEHGAVIKMSQKQVQWFAIQISKGARKGGRGRGSGRRGGTVHMLVIPKRPFIEPSTEVWQRGVEGRLQAHMAKTMKIGA